MDVSATKLSILFSMISPSILMNTMFPKKSDVDQKFVHAEAYISCN